MRSFLQTSSGAPFNAGIDYRRRRAYPRGMLHLLLKKSDWAFLLDFVSPAFFKVIPPAELLSNATALAKRTQDAALYSSSIRHLQDKVIRSIPELVVQEGKMILSAGTPTFQVSASQESARRELAQCIVKIYFSQICAGSPVMLDLRLSRFVQQNENFEWRPAPLIGVFSQEFMSTMSSLYMGFYGKNPEQMRSALALLGLDWAFDEFMRHFGEGDQTQVRFTMSHFVRTFHEIFMKCRSEKKNLKGEFVQLGVILGLMYESLETLDVEVDVRKAFFDVTSSHASS